MGRLQEDLAAQYLLYRDEYDARKLLITNISSMSYATEGEADDDMEGRWDLCKTASTNVIRYGVCTVCE